MSYTWILPEHESTDVLPGPQASESSQMNALLVFSHADKRWIWLFTRNVAYDLGSELVRTSSE